MQPFDQELNANFITSDALAFVDEWCATATGYAGASNQFLRATPFSPPANLNSSDGADLVGVLHATTNPPLLSSAIVPTDVVIDPSEKFAIVRSMESNYHLSISVNYGRISIIDLATATLVREIDAGDSQGPLFTPIGASWGIDHLEATADYVITGGEEAVGIGVTPDVGWIQIVKLR